MRKRCGKDVDKIPKKFEKSVARHLVAEVANPALSKASSENKKEDTFWTEKSFLNKLKTNLNKLKTLN